MNSSFEIYENFTGGSLILGLFEFRNVLEAVALAGSLAAFEYKILMMGVGNIIVNIVVFMLTVIPLGLVCLVGINGESFLNFLKSIFLFFKNRRKICYKRIVVQKKRKTNKAKLAQSSGGSKKRRK